MWLCAFQRRGASCPEGSDQYRANSIRQGDMIGDLHGKHEQGRQEHLDEEPLDDSGSSSKGSTHVQRSRGDSLDNCRALPPRQLTPV